MIDGEALNAAQAASILHIGRNAVYELARTGALPSYRIGRKVFFSRRDLEAYLEAARTGGGASAERAAGAPAPDEQGVDGFVLAGNGMPADLIAERLRAAATPCHRADLTSYDALCALYAGRASAAVVHLYDQRTNSYNIPFVQRLVPGTSATVFRLVKREQGFVVAKGNPRSIGSWGALLRPDTRLANRVRGCGSRVLLDEKLLAMEARGEAIPGYRTDYPSGLMAARAVASGAADVTVVGAQIAAQVPDADFIPLQSEWLDLVVVKTERTRELLRRIRTMLDDPGFRAEYARITQGAPTHFGAIVYEC